MPCFVTLELPAFAETTRTDVYLFTFLGGTFYPYSMCYIEVAWACQQKLLAMSNRAHRSHRCT
jgi:hypothetical protein